MKRNQIVPGAVKRSTMNEKLIPELLQQIALFLPTACDMFVYLEAIPSSYRTEALQSLLNLYFAVYHGRLYFPKTDPTYPRRVHLWPNLVLPSKLNQPDIAHWVEKIMVLYPVVEVHHVVVPLPYPLLPNTKLSFDYPIYPKELELVLTHWRERAISILLLISDNGRVMDGTIDGIVLALQELPALRRLELSWFGESISQKFPQVLDAIKLSSITKVDFSDCHVDWDESNVHTFVDWIKTKPIKSIVFPKTTIHRQSLPLLGQALLASRSLRSLYIANQAVVTELMKEKHRFPFQLTSLMLKPCAFTAIPNLVYALQNTPLSTLKLYFEHTAVWNEEQVNQLTVETIPKLVRLRHLRIDRLPITPLSSSAFSLMLPRLVDLCLKENSLYDIGVLVLVSALPHCKKLQSLRLSKQSCTNVSAFALEKMIPKCPSLRELDLSGNRISSAGATALSGVVTSLEDLILSENDIGSDGAVALVRAMGTSAKTALSTWLLLDLNPLEKAGVMEVINAVTSSPYRYGHIDLRCTVDDPQEIVDCERAIEALPCREWCWWDA
ncbi:hypothetical protein THRCLA_04608 [Thraustotheca clavata]|uniref:RNI-like protein n=1 Tax=Thraustotheca clavata TaxID=74557 RepID=A0A1V9ZYK6_9STRA|nr:hypothetical protein THRCLA_04608 [Thraustotheca clavata]